MIYEDIIFIYYFVFKFYIVVDSYVCFDFFYNVIYYVVVLFFGNKFNWSCFFFGDYFNGRGFLVSCDIVIIIEFYDFFFVFGDCISFIFFLK